jgi:hypothetical protein
MITEVEIRGLEEGRKGARKVHGLLFKVLWDFYFEGLASCCDYYYNILRGDKIIFIM